ncbi:uncharacterized protein V1518DRAFT_419479 [Limtongia smithiae]|uniref:uncharacterized protein n=1 Tax=Limtongia smithiae TaxID=1125753 RepID=UPI0034CDA93D
MERSLDELSAISASTITTSRLDNAMFGAICAGRPVQTNLEQVDPTKYVFRIEDGAKVNHIVVFLLPGAVLGEGMAASVYFQWPGKPFRLLGSVSNTKPSAIFRVNQRTQPSSVPGSSMDDMTDDLNPAADPIEILLGISLEPEQQVEAQLSAVRSTTLSPVTGALMRPGQINNSAVADPSSIAGLANRIVSHAFNFLSGFATAEGMVPLKAFSDWWAKFQNKLAVDPQFLQKLDE